MKANIAGGMYSNLPVEIQNCSFIVNIAAEEGGGIYMTPDARTNVVDTIFTSNYIKNQKK